MMMARPTASFQLYAQTFGRALRIMIYPKLMAQWDAFTEAQRLEHIAQSVKPKALIIDHVNNWQRHGLPDIPRSYSLNRREKRGRQLQTDAIPLRTCLSPECLQPYERHLIACPYCGTAPTPAGRSAPELVDGDLVELDADTLASLRSAIARVDAAPRFPMGAAPEVIGSIKRSHRERQEAQAELREVMSLWGGYQKHIGRSDREAWKLFFLRFGVDVRSAQASRRHSS